MGFLLTASSEILIVFIELLIWAEILSLNA